MNFKYIIFSYFALFTLGIIDISRGPIYPSLLKVFNISNLEGSLIFSISSLTGFLVTLSSPLWLKKYGVVNPTKVALFLHFLSCFSMGLSYSSQYGYYIFLLGAIFLGLGLGINSLTVNLLVTNCCEYSKQRKTLSGLHSMYGLSALLAPSVIGLIFKIGIDWGTYFYFLSLIPLCILLSSILLKDNFKEQSRLVFKLNLKESIIIGLIFSLYISVEMILSTRIVIFLNEIKGFDIESSSHLLSLFFVLLLIGRLSFSFISVPLSSTTILKISVLGTLISTILGTFFSGYFIVLSGLFLSVFFPFGVEWLSGIYKEKVNNVMSRTMTIVGGVLVLSHYTFGVIATNFGLDKAMVIVMFMSAVVLYLLQFHTDSLNDSD